MFATDGGWGLGMRFRKVTAIFRPDRLEEVEDRLRSLGVPCVSVIRVKGFGEYANFYEPDWLCQHVRIEVFTSKLKADEIAEAIMTAAPSSRPAPASHRCCRGPFVPGSGFGSPWSALVYLVIPFFIEDSIA